MTWEQILAEGQTRVSRLLSTGAVKVPTSTVHSWIHRGGPAPWLVELIVQHVNLRKILSTPEIADAELGHAVREIFAEPVNETCDQAK